jgi:alkylated DNA repair dioxygenase AlkB
MAELPLTPEVVTLYGKQHVTTRLSAQYGLPYGYNKDAKPPLPMTPLVENMQRRIEELTGETYNQILFNYYPDGSTGIGWHKDKGGPEIITTISLGATRKYRIAPLASTSGEDIMVEHGSALVLPGHTNETHKHCISETKRILEPRLSVTLRRMPRKHVVPSVMP